MANLRVNSDWHGVSHLAGNTLIPRIEPETTVPGIRVPFLHPAGFVGRGKFLTIDIAGGTTPVGLAMV